LKYNLQVIPNHEVFYLTAEKLKKYFKQYGAVQDAVVMKDPVSKRSRGFGFVTFVEASSVDEALENGPHTIDSRKVLRRFHCPIFVPNVGM
jgi:RNA recognition motif-containing protein